MGDRLSGIDAFVEAVEAGSFALAAERMHLTRSAVGKSIARLEERLGIRLFHRTTRSQSLTDDGQAYYERCVRALAELDAAHGALESGRTVPIGRLRLSAPVLFGRHCITPVLLNLMQQHPQLNIEMSFNDRYVDMVDEGFDLAIRVGNAPDSATLIARRLGRQNMCICAAPAYLERFGTPTDIDHLADHSAIAYGRSGVIKPWLIRGKDGQVRKAKVNIRMVFDDIQAIADAAVQGAGLAWLPCWLIAKHARSGELKLVMDSTITVAADIFAVWPQSRYLPTRTRLAIDALVDRIPAMVGALEHFDHDVCRRS